jgi:hypothetical protein
VSRVKEIECRVTNLILGILNRRHTFWTVIIITFYFFRYPCQYIEYDLPVMRLAINSLNTNLKRKGSPSKDSSFSFYSPLFIAVSILDPFYRESNHP